MQCSQSYPSLDRRVSLSAPAVRDRLNRLKNNGVLQGFMLSMDSSVFDRDDLLLFFHGNFSRVNVDDVRKIMGETALLRYIQEPLMKYVLCRGNSLADVITKTRALEKVQGVESVEISFNQEVLVSTDLRHSLIREEITRLEKNRALRKTFAVSSSLQ